MIARLHVGSRLARIAVSLAAVGLAFVTVGIGLALLGSDPIDAFRQMGNAAFGSPFAISNTIVKTMPRLLAALGIAVALRAGLWNIGFKAAAFPTTLGGTVHVKKFITIPVMIPEKGLDLVGVVPIDMAFCGVSFYHQIYIADPFASDGISFSRGVQLKIGL